MQRPFIPVGLTHSDSGKVNSLHARLRVLREVGIFENLSPRSRLADPAGHNSGVELSPRVKFIEAETEGELPGVRVQRGFEESVACFPQFLFDGSIGELTCEPGQLEAIASVSHGNVAISQEAHRRGAELPSGFSDFSSLGSEIPSRCD